MFCIQDFCPTSVELAAAAVVLVLAFLAAGRYFLDSLYPEVSGQIKIGQKILYGTDQGCTCHLVVTEIYKDEDRLYPDILGQFLVTIPAGAKELAKSFDWWRDEIRVIYQISGENPVLLFFDVFEEPAELAEYLVHTDNGLKVETASAN